MKKRNEKIIKGIKEDVMHIKHLKKTIDDLVNIEFDKIHDIIQIKKSDEKKIEINIE